MLRCYVLLLLIFVGCAPRHQQAPIIIPKVPATTPYDWNVPIVQEVKVPAHIENGMFIAEHTQLVLVKPGQWTKTQEETHENVTTISDAADITYMP